MSITFSLFFSSSFFLKRKGISVGVRYHKVSLVANLSWKNMCTADCLASARKSGRDAMLAACILPNNDWASD